tara:strand:+ start:209 stop:811 length:603 start_codon:yes stop_codon:yes gene_type:complete
MKWTGIIDMNGVDIIREGNNVNYTYLQVRSQANKYNNAMIFEVDLKGWQYKLIKYMLERNMKYDVAKLLHDPDFVEQLEVQVGGKWESVPIAKLDYKSKLKNNTRITDMLQELMNMPLRDRLEAVLNHKKSDYKKLADASRMEEVQAEGLHEFSMKKGWRVAFFDKPHYYVYQYKNLPDAEPDLDMEFINAMKEAGGVTI